MFTRIALRAAAITAASALVLAGAASSASAHVTVSSPDAKPGGYAKLVFRVPTESDTASTTKLVVSLPKDYPFASVGAQVKDGWKVVKATEKLATPVKVGDVTLSQAVTTVTWTATAGGVPAGDFDEFALSVGRLPEGVDTLSFPAEQTYSDGEVVKWAEVAADGAEEPEHPAPSLKLTSAITPVAAGTDDDGDDDEAGSDTVARGLGAAGLLLGLVALGLALRRRPPSAAPTASPGDGTRGADASGEAK
ncbi:nuclear export factor GLE1 [Kribbella flavida DSM 17836]|uniref:Nuclear export factor GLE1 n=1 Tax=Kribbella flavida (strain DSM 17836 / JCM 10339 / NBRC 14399) TaxID=479435 RepID=D2PQ54_KRIFD|nr:YcnI family protein [Kribbella flavida]ADB34756.1 nuclear export factor GLE1 [Kribbella flavida DSM 17836]